MQKVLRLSSVTYDWTQVTPSSPLFATTARQVFSPLASMGIDRPSGKVRSTRYRGMSPSFHSKSWTGSDRKGRRAGRHRERSLFCAGFLRFEQGGSLRFGDSSPARANAQLVENGRHVVIDGLGRDKQAGGDLAIGQAERERVEDLLLAGGEIEGMLAARGARPPRDCAHAQLGQSAAKAGRGRTRLQLVEGFQRRQHCLRVVALVAGQSRLVRAAKPLVLGGGAPPVALDLQRHRAGALVRGRWLASAAPDQDGEVGDVPGPARLPGLLDQGRGLRGGSWCIAAQPEKLAARSQDRHHALQLAALPRQRQRLIERLAGSGVAAPRAQEAERS